MSELPYCLVAAIAILLAGCGGGSAPPSGSPAPPAATVAAATPVTLLLSSTANDRLSQYNIGLSGLTLTSQSGKTITVLAKAQNAEFMHLNGGVESLLTVALPQDVYTSATATIGSVTFSCVALNPSGGIEAATFSYGATPSGDVTVNLPQPITVAATPMGLVLNLLVSQSATISNCGNSNGTLQPYTITPTFNLTAMTIAAQPTDVTNGLETNLDGLIASVAAGGSGLTVTAADGPQWSVSTNGNTLFQGIADAAGLAAGLPVDMDVSIQADGSLLAARIAVQDTNTADLSVWRGPLLFVSDAEPALTTLPIEAQGQLWNNTAAGSGASNSGVTEPLGGWMLTSGAAAFQTSPQFANLPGLPFHAGFNAANMVAGQNIFIGTNAADFPNSPNYVPAGTITLMPQTINGTVTSLSAQGGFTVYTVALAGYDRFSILAQQPGQTTLLQNSGTIIVYADAGTQMLNTDSASAGSVLRFNGLVFNDGGTLRMDCREVLDGVAP